MQRTTSTDRTTRVDLDPVIAPLARIVIPGGRSGYVHYSTLAKRLLGSLSQAPGVANVVTGDPVILPGKGLMIWPESHIMAYLQATPCKRIRLENRTVSEPIALCPLIWIWKFNDKPPHALSRAKLFCATSLPLLPIEDVLMKPWLFGNVHPDGEVCWGSVHTNHLTWAKPEDVDAVFWGSVPNDDLVYSIAISHWVADENRPALISYCRDMTRQSIQAIVSTLHDTDD